MNIQIQYVTKMSGLGPLWDWMLWNVY